MEKKLLYWDWIKAEAKAISSDGCTKAIDFRRECCELHDLAYYWAKDPRDAYRNYLNGFPDYWKCAKGVTRREADKLIRQCYRDKSPVDGFSIVAWTRYIGIRLGAWIAWNKHRRREKKNASQ